MAYTVVFSSLAGQHLDDLYSLVADASGEARADKFVGSIVQYCLGFDLFPERGLRRDDLWPGLRIVGFKRVASIAFRVNANVVIIHGVYYRGQNWEADLWEEMP